jgi:hypothetical protein
MRIPEVSLKVFKFEGFRACMQEKTKRYLLSYFLAADSSCSMNDRDPHISSPSFLGMMEELENGNVHWALLHFQV